MLKLLFAEQWIRKHFGSTPDAERILVFSEPSHWDPDWLFTSKD